MLDRMRPNGLENCVEDICGAIIADEPPRPQGTVHPLSQMMPAPAVDGHPRTSLILTVHLHCHAGFFGRTIFRRNYHANSQDKNQEKVQYWSHGSTYAAFQLVEVKCILVT